LEIAALVAMLGRWNAQSDPGRARPPYDMRPYRAYSARKCVASWVKARRPAGSVVSITGKGGQYGTTVMWSVTLAFPAVPAQVSAEGLGVAVTAARGGGTAMGVDAFAIWWVRDRQWKLSRPGHVFCSCLSITSTTTCFP
jgi:hypothetical protein